MMFYYIVMHFVSGNTKVVEVTEQQFRRYRNIYHDSSQNPEKDLPQIIKVKNDYYMTQHIEFIAFGDIRKG